MASYMLCATIVSVFMRHSLKKNGPESYRSTARAAGWQQKVRLRAENMTPDTLLEFALR